MEFEDILVVNRNITLVVPEGRNAGRYPSRIEDVGADAVVVAAPTRKGAVLRLSEGDVVRVQVPQQDAVYAFDTAVEAVIMYPFPMLQLARPVEIEREQRRRYVRVDASLPARYRPPNPEAMKRLAPYKGTTVNVSGGGALIMTLQYHKALDVGSQVDVELELPNYKVSAKGVVVRMSTERGQAGKSQRIAVEFKDIDERQRDMLVKYVLQRQLELRRKGLL